MKYTKRDHQNTMLNVYIGGLIALGLGLIFFAVVAMTGCAARVKNVTNLPPGVTMQQAQNWDTAVADLHKIASTVTTFRQTLTALHGAQYDGKPVLSDEYYSEGLRMIGNVDRLELSAEIVLRGSPQNFSDSTKTQVAFYVKEISTELNNLNAAGATGIKNPKSLQQVNTLLGEVSGIVGLILAL
jgi:hypothetical protein